MQLNYQVDTRGGSGQGGGTGAHGRGGASRRRGGGGRRKSGGPKQQEKRGKYDHSKSCHLGLCLELNGKLGPKKKGSDKCASCCNNVARARRVAMAQDCVKWFDDKRRRSTDAAAASGKGQPDPEFHSMMKEFTSSCPAQGRGRRTGLFDMGRYMESSVLICEIEDPHDEKPQFCKGSCFLRFNWYMNECTRALARDCRAKVAIRTVALLSLLWCSAVQFVRLSRYLV